MKNLVDEDALTDALHEFLQHPSEIGYVGRLRKATEVYEQAKLDRQDKLLREFEEAEKDDSLPDIEPPKVPEKKLPYEFNGLYFDVSDEQKAIDQLIDCVNYLMNKGRYDNR